MQKSTEYSKQHLLSSYKRTSFFGSNASIHLHARIRSWMHQMLKRLRLNVCCPPSFTRLAILLLMLLFVSQSEAAPTISSSSSSSPGLIVKQTSLLCKPFLDRNANALTEANQDMYVHLIVEESERAQAHANIAIEKYLEKVFEDKSFSESVRHLKPDWLPQLQVSSKATLDEVLRESYLVLQHFSLAFAKTVVDEAFFDLSLMNLFREEETYLLQVLNKVQKSACSRNLDLDSWRRIVLDARYNEVSQNSKRFLRNYLLLREYSQTTAEIHRLFSSFLIKNQL